MMRPSFGEGVAVAFIASLAGSVLYAGLSTLWDGAVALRVLIAALALGYILYLLHRSGGRVGRVTALALWSVAAGGLWLTHAPLEVHVLVHLGFVWLLRSLYFHASVLAAGADLGLNLLSVAAAIWAARRTESVFVTSWCFFLVQALFAAIAPSPRKTAPALGADERREERFEHAYRTAQAAVRRLSSVR